MRGRQRNEAEKGGGIKNRGGNGRNRGIIGLRRDSGDPREFADMNGMSSRLVFRPKGSKFRGSHGVGARRELKEEKVKWAVIAIRFSKGWNKGVEKGAMAGTRMEPRRQTMARSLWICPRRPARRQGRDKKTTKEDKRTERQTEGGMGGSGVPTFHHPSPRMPQQVPAI